eukprot:PhM_4_TR6759/c0_g2_i1/m.91940
MQQPQETETRTSELPPHVEQQQQQQQQPLDATGPQLPPELPPPVYVYYTIPEIITPSQLRLSLTAWFVFIILAVVLYGFSLDWMFACTDFCGGKGSKCSTAFFFSQPFDHTMSDGCFFSMQPTLATSTLTTSTISANISTTNTNTTATTNFSRFWRSETLTLPPGDGRLRQSAVIQVSSNDVVWDEDVLHADVIVRGWTSNVGANRSAPSMSLLYEVSHKPLNVRHPQGDDTKMNWILSLMEDGEDWLPSNIEAVTLEFPRAPVTHVNSHHNISVVVAMTKPRGIVLASVMHFLQAVAGFALLIYFAYWVEGNSVIADTDSTNTSPATGCVHKCVQFFVRFVPVIRAQPVHVQLCFALLFFSMAASDPFIGIYLHQPAAKDLRWLSRGTVSIHRGLVYVFQAYCLCVITKPWDVHLEARHVRRPFYFIVVIVIPWVILMWITEGTSHRDSFLDTDTSRAIHLSTASFFVLYLMVACYVLFRRRHRFMWKTGRVGIYHDQNVRHFALWLRFTINILLTQSFFYIVVSIGAALAVATMLPVTMLAGWIENIIHLSSAVILLGCAVQLRYASDEAPPNSVQNILWQTHATSDRVVWTQRQFDFLKSHNMSSYSFELEADKREFDRKHTDVTGRRSFFCWETAIRALNISNEVYETVAAVPPLPITEVVAPTSRSSCCGVDDDDDDHHAAPQPSMDVSRFGYKLHHCFLIDGIQVILCHRPGEIVIAFRGTANMSNVLTDLHATRKTWAEMKERDSSVRVHTGIVNAWDKIRVQLFPVMLELLTRLLSLSLSTSTSTPLEDDIPRILVTGHSLGGGLALLCSYSLQAGIGRAEVTARLPAPVVPSLVCYVFGSPAIGNNRFARLYNKHCTETYRIENENDGITSFARLMFHVHSGRTVVVERDGNCLVEPNAVEIEYEFLRGGGSIVRNHFMTRYCASMSKLRQSLQLMRTPMTFCEMAHPQSNDSVSIEMTPHTVADAATRIEASDHQRMDVLV